MKEYLTGLVMDEEHQITLYELCEVCHAESGWVVSLVEYGVLNPQGEKPESWQFSGLDIDRSKKAWRLQHDLQINLEGLAIVLDLLDELDDLRDQLHHWEKLHGGR